MNKYEVLYVIDAAMEDQARSELIAQFGELMANNGATVEKVDEWGKRRLAYPINFKNEGFYVLMTFTAPADLPKEIERQMSISDSVYRFMTTKA